MYIFVNIILLIVLSLVIYQDLKMRLIHFSLPTLIFVIGITTNYNVILITEMLFSVIFLGVVFFVLLIYLFFTRRKLFNPVDNNIGLGDVLFLLSVIPFFRFYHYILFFTFGMLFVLIVHLVFNSMYKKEHKELIPMAGYLSILMLGVIFFNLIESENLFEKVIS